MKYIIFDNIEEANLRNENLLVEGVNQELFSNATKFCTVLQNSGGDKFAIPFIPAYEVLYTNAEKLSSIDLPNNWYATPLAGHEVIVNITQEAPPSNIITQDYDILGYHKKRVFIKGELLTTEYYSAFDESTKVYSDLRVKETNQYFREDGFVVKRTKNIQWYLNSTPTISKVTNKYYSVQEAINEGITRRTNVISNIKSKAWFLLGDANSYDLLLTLKQEIELYINAHTAPLLGALASIERDYLDDFLPNTEIPMRAYFISELTL